MITTSNTTQSDWIDSRAEWPMKSYMFAWRLFRRLSDESQVTAEHLLSRRLWPHSLRNLRIADFGCGDGRLIEALILSSPKPISTVHLIDINPELLEQAKCRVESLGLINNVKTSHASAADTVLGIAGNADVALAVHLVYLLKESETQKFIARLAPGIPLFIVMDQPTSIFTRLWERTAPKYHKRSVNAHKIVTMFNESGYIVERTEFDTHLTNPLSLRKDIRDSVLSLLCYSDFGELDQETQSWVVDVISEHSTSDRVVCDCVCYELVLPS